MPILRPKLEIPISSPSLPAPLMFRSAHVPAEGVYPLHQHAWGEFVYSFSGVMEVKVAEHHFLAPPQYGLWLPPDLQHVGLNRKEAHHCSLYVSRPLCGALPATPCALTVSPLVRALLEHLRQLPTGAPNGEEDARLLQVLLDQLAVSPRAGSYLPSSEDPQLAAVLRLLQTNPGDNRALPELAHAVHTTERTLTRRCQRDLGMSLAEWRQRLRVVRAMPLLEAGQTVETIALDLGYGSASAFISMFKKLMGTTPDEYRKGVVGKAAAGA
ncbi:AraC family transcriptional regulator [Rhodoferax saidenbachensis]|uniref:AraC family transcriptional regulator n=1 Tax=Rhodoferax saidenbachensis TaxID=1484693 RepID=A0A1P8K5K8_9BURK|nr:helix-turn-helix transcriptional regulator [Rhodoferax saidenbachensis]APW41201.1 AraC family transcriptional regulator [Rhodoferax saidenbachensis]